MDGIYAMYFTGNAGFGHAVFVLKDGVLVGADAVGGVLDGEYKITDQGEIKFSINLTIPAGASLVTGVHAGNEPLTQLIEGNLPHNFSNGNPIALRTPTGPVNVSFKRLRNLV